MGGGGGCADNCRDGRPHHRSGTGNGGGCTHYDSNDASHNLCTSACCDDGSANPNSNHAAHNRGSGTYDDGGSANYNGHDGTNNDGSCTHNDANHGYPDHLRDVVLRVALSCPPIDFAFGDLFCKFNP